MVTDNTTFITTVLLLIPAGTYFMLQCHVCMFSVSTERGNHNLSFLSYIQSLLF